MTQKRFTMTRWARGLPRILAVAALVVTVPRCAHHAPAVLHRQMAVISGKSTANDSAVAARRKVLVEGAAITLDHGYRYFEILREGTPIASKEPAIQPGADVTIKLFGEGEADPRSPGVWDADAIGAGLLP